MDGKRIQRSVLSRAVRGQDSVVNVNASKLRFYSRLHIFYYHLTSYTEYGTFLIRYIPHALARHYSHWPGRSLTSASALARTSGVVRSEPDLFGETLPRPRFLVTGLRPG